MALLILFGVWFFGLLLFHQLEQRLGANVHAHYRTGYPRRGYVADVLWTAVNGPGLTALEKIAFFYLVTLVPPAWIGMGAWSWAAQFAVFLLINDFGRYWLHRWYHDVNLLWRVHRVHHTAVEMDALSVFRHHVLEAVAKTVLLQLPMRLLGVSESVILVYTIVDVLKGFWHHANLRCYIGPLNYVLNSPELHWWHHSTEARGQRANFGSLLSIWDWIFGTAYWPRGQWPETIGVEGLERFPESFLGQLASIRFDDGEAERRFARDDKPPNAGAYAPAAPPHGDDGIRSIQAPDGFVHA